MATPAELLSREAERLDGLARYHKDMVNFLTVAKDADERKVTAALWREWREIQACEERLEVVRTQALRGLTE